jgi:hypothetical protein
MNGLAVRLALNFVVAWRGAQAAFALRIDSSSAVINAGRSVAKVGAATG